MWSARPPVLNVCSLQSANWGAASSVCHQPFRGRLKAPNFLERRPFSRFKGLMPHLNTEWRSTGPARWESVCSVRLRVLMHNAAGGQLSRACAVVGIRVSMCVTVSNSTLIGDPILSVCVFVCVCVCVCLCTAGRGALTWACVTGLPRTELWSGLFQLAALCRNGDGHQTDLLLLASVRRRPNEAPR